MRQNLFSGKTMQQGVVLVEAMVAILIFSIGVLAIAGLQASMIKNTSELKFRSDASYIAQKRIGEIWADQCNVNNYVEAPTSISELPNGTRQTTTQLIALPSDYYVTVTVRWQQPGQDPHQFATTTSIAGC